MRVDMVGAILRIVFNHEDGGVLPIGAVRNGIDNASDREIVIGYRSLWRGLSGTRASGMVIRKIEQCELREFFGAPLCFHKLVKLPQKFIGAKLIGIIGIEIGKERVKMIA